MVNEKSEMSKAESDDSGNDAAKGAACRNYSFTFTKNIGKERIILGYGAVGLGYRLMCVS